MRNILMLFVISLFANNLFAQGAYVNINTGYGFNMSSQNLYNFDFYNYTTGDDSFFAEQVNVSLGKGFNFGGAIGYMFNKNIGVELGVSYLLGDEANAQDDNAGEIYDFSISSNMLRINPSLVIASGFEKVVPYAKFGLIIGSGSVMYEVVFNEGMSERNWIFDGGIGLGLSSGIGAAFNVSENMSFFTELNMVNLSYAPTEGELTVATIDGTDILPSLSISEKEIEFVDSYTFNYDNLPADSQPDKELKQKMPFGSFGINIGLKIGF